MRKISYIDIQFTCDLQFIVVKPKGNNNNNKYRSVVGDGITYSTQELAFLKIALFLKNNDILLMILYKFYILLYTGSSLSETMS